jgi:3-hydroxyisobutyrate dehydrogenase
MATIAFVGLGRMGMPMAVNLLKAGHRLCVFDVSPEAPRKLKEHGAEAAASAKEAVSAAEFVITMLPAGPEVREVYLNGVIPNAAPATLFVDCSTIDVADAREIAAAAKAAGFDMLDAPVSGGVAGAEAATLTFMVGGSHDAFERAAPILKAMGKAVVHAGGSGNGQAAKICNNMVLGVSMIAVCEAFLLA